MHLSDQTPLSNPRVESARAGQNPKVVCRLPSGWVFLCDRQYLSGYAILTADPMVASINDLDEAGRAAFLCDMARVGDALIAVCGAHRVNYAVMGNSDAYLHAHIVPRYLDEMDDVRHDHPWSYPHAVIDGRPFDAQRDRDLMRRLAGALQARA
jgi:diadenosine tetraphosphate (Ap4A) HIT family hydrolase